MSPLSHWNKVSLVLNRLVPLIYFSSHLKSHLADPIQWFVLLLQSICLFTITPQLLLPPMLLPTFPPKLVFLTCTNAKSNFDYISQYKHLKILNNVVFPWSNSNERAQDVWHRRSARVSDDISQLLFKKRKKKTN